ncbi:MAG: hypothetical protein EOQ40_30500 [Mesorhizobium sp.]|uniref:ATP-binding protein n=1 Tax=Mesorhizobium sp. TaxID=1871066 RepID=UPI000FE5F51E|nr:hypothetical protein [Mesorhizobium sp.]RWB14359.1 MAG: hypothetical protein EOQ40_30500 [Mesorhizobium sp.]
MLTPSKAINIFADTDVFDSIKLFSAEFHKLGLKTRNRGRLLIASSEGKQCLLLKEETSFTALTAYRMLKDKRLARAAFREAGVSFADGKAFNVRNREGARQKVAEFGIAVVKPADGNKGRGVSVNVTSETFDVAWDAALRLASSHILVERCFTGGDEARYLVVDERCVAVTMRTPPFLIGDGRRSVSKLIDNKNKVRSGNPHLRSRPILLDSFRKLILKSQSLEPDSVPASGQRVILDWKSNASTGGETTEITDYAHPSMKRVAERVASAIPGLHVGGIDILSKDHTAEANPQDYIVVEANTRPDLGLHLFPMYGKPVNVCELIAESCVKHMGINARRVRGMHIVRANGGASIGP